MKLIPMLGCVALVCAAAALAETPPSGVTASPPTTAPVKPLTPQQERMKSCNATAAERKLSGTERQTYMQKCLSGKPPATSGNASQERMKHCNAEANKQQLKGDARKAFMSTCLKSD